MTLLPRWMRIAMLATAVMNLAVAPALLPVGAPLRELAGLPAQGEPVYLAMVAMFVALFGVGYLWTALTGRPDRTFILVAGLGKIAFVALLLGYWLFGALSFRAPLAASPDLVFGVLFLRWLRAG